MGTFWWFGPFSNSQKKSVHFCKQFVKLMAQGFHMSHVQNSKQTKTIGKMSLQSFNIIIFVNDNWLNNQIKIVLMPRWPFDLFATTSVMQQIFLLLCKYIRCDQRGFFCNYGWLFWTSDRKKTTSLLCNEILAWCSLSSS